MELSVSRKTIFHITMAVIAVYLIIHYWSAIAKAIGTVYEAAAPLIVGGLIAYIINILMAFYEKHYFVKKNPPLAQKTRTAVCLISAILTILLVFGLIIGLVIPQFVKCVQVIINKAPGIINKVINDLQGNEKIMRLVPASVADWIENYQEKLAGIDWQSLIQKVVGFLKTGFSGAAGKLSDALSSVASKAISVLLGIIFGIYFLADRERILRNFRRMADNYLKEKQKNKILHFFGVFNECFHKYIVAQCLEALILGGLCLLGMTILRLPYAAMLSALVALMALVPIVGATISAVVGSFMLLSVSPWKALTFFIMLMVVQVVEGNLIYPKVVGKSVGAPGLIVLIAVSVGGTMFGILGMMFSVPAFTAVYNELRADMGKREQLRAAAPPAAPATEPPAPPEPPEPPEPETD